MRELGLRVLGVAELTLDGAPIRLQRRRSLALLAYLALTKRSHTREELAALLASESAAGPARKRLRNILSDLRAHGLGDFLLVSRQTIAFNTAMPYRIDIDELDSLLAPGATLDPAALEWATERFGRELLAGLALRDAPIFESWLLREREYRGQQLTQLARRLLEQQLLNDQLDAGIALARRLLAVEPWQEDVHRHLMQLLARDGQLAAALEQYQRCRRDLAEELGVEPQSETMALYERLRAGPSAPRNNLPASATDLLGDLYGREAQLDEISQALVEPACRLLTLVGLGGSGKTRLAQAAAVRLSATAADATDHPFADGIILVELRDIPPPGAGGDAVETAERRLATAIGLGLGLVFYRNLDPLEQVIAYLQQQRLLLILDNIEQLTDSVAVLRAILRSAPGVTLLATSRTPLDLPEEWMRYVAGLPLPERAADIPHSPAGRLFLREARRAGATIAPEDEPHVVQICRLTGGLPLALKVTAGWLPAVSCAEIVAQLERGGALLDRRVSTEEDRQVSIRALLGSVWRGLPTAEQRALRRLAVFPARFDALAADAVDVTLASLLALCRRSLLERAADGGYVLHPLLRQYAETHLARDALEAAQVRASHATFYASFMTRHTGALREHRTAHALIGAELPNVSAAWDWAIEQGDVALLTQLWPGLAAWHQLAGLHLDWAETLARGVTRLTVMPRIDDDPALRDMVSLLLLAEADATHWQGESTRALRLLADARHYAVSPSAAAFDARIQLREGRILHVQGHTRAALDLLRQAQASAKAARDPRFEGHALLAESYALADYGEYASAEQLLVRANEIYRDLGDRLSLGRTTLHAGRLHTAWGNFDQARLLLNQSLHLSADFLDRPSEGWASVYLGLVYGPGLGRHREAEQHFNSALKIARKMHDHGFRAYVRWAQGRNALQVGDLEHAAQYFEEAFDIGRSLGSPAVESRGLLGLGQLALVSGAGARAADYAERAALFARESGRRHEAAAASLLLGRAQERLGLSPEAVTAYASSFALANRLALPYLACDAAAGLANCALASDDTEQAAEYATVLYSFLNEQALAGCEEPDRVVLTCYRAFDAIRDERRDEVLRLGVRLLERRAAALPGPDRARYLRAFPARRALLQRAFEEHLTDKLVSDMRPASIATTSFTGGYAPGEDFSPE